MFPTRWILSIDEIPARGASHPSGPVYFFIAELFMTISPVVFREYDIRGTVGVDLSEEFAFLLGRAYAGLIKESAPQNGTSTVAVGYDARISSPSYSRELIRGISTEGVNVVAIGICPTPQLYFTVFDQKLAGGIMVTGSHNPPDMNGFKIGVGQSTLSGEAIQDLYHRMIALKPVQATTQVGAVTERSNRQEYIDMLVKNSQPHVGSRKLKVVVDGGNGVGGLVGPEVLRRLGYDVIELYCDPDGRFPNHHPDPTVVKNLTALIAKVKEVKADCGIGWDGDADRIGVVDESGDPIFGDMLLLIYAREMMKTIPHPTVIGDVKCSSRLFDDLKSRGANPIMWKTGHSLIKGKLKETHGELAGEMSGHIFFKHRYYGFDDALYASCRFLEVVSHTSSQVSQILNDLSPTVSTPEIRLDCPEELKFKIAEKMPSAFKGYTVDTTDGARVKFPHGWGLVRASNTQPVLVMRFEAETPDQLKEYEALMVKKVEEAKATL